MKITRSQLKQIIKEELSNALTEKQSIKAIIKPIGRMTRYILKTLNYDEDRDVDYGIPGKDPGFVDDKQWAEHKGLVQTTLSKIPKAARADAMYDEIMTNIQKPRLHRTEIADFASAFDEYFIGLEAMVRDGDLKCKSLKNNLKKSSRKNFQPWKKAHIILLLVSYKIL